MRKCEIWKEIKDYEGLYEVSSFGRVKSMNYNCTGEEKILKPGKLNNGYLQVHLYKDRKPKNFKVHRLVTQHFIPNPLNLPEVNHKDENKENNCVENLEWCDRMYNNNYGTRTEKTCKKVYQYTKSGEFVRVWESQIKIERELGYSIGSISKCCNGKRKSAYGFIWTYEKERESN